MSAGVPPSSAPGEMVKIRFVVVFEGHSHVSVHGNTNSAHFGKIVNALKLKRPVIGSAFFIEIWNSGTTYILDMKKDADAVIIRDFLECPDKKISEFMPETDET